MPTARVSRTVAAEPEAVWRAVGDPHHLARWWPKLRRVESVSETGFTQVLVSDRGRPIRADFTVVEDDPPHRRAWRQEVAGSPFERFLQEAVTCVELAPEGEGTRVTLTSRQRLRGLARLGGFLARRGTRRLLSDALDGLERLL